MSLASGRTGEHRLRRMPIGLSRRSRPRSGGGRPRPLFCLRRGDSRRHRWRQRIVRPPIVSRRRRPPQRTGRRTLRRILWSRAAGRVEWAGGTQRKSVRARDGRRRAPDDSCAIRSELPTRRVDARGTECAQLGPVARRPQHGARRAPCGHAGPRRADRGTRLRQAFHSRYDGHDP